MVLNLVVKKLKKQDQHDILFEQVHAQLTEHLSLNISEILNQTEDDIIDILKSDYSFNNESIGIFGDILFELGESGQSKFPETDLFLNTLLIYKYLETTDEVYSIDRHLRIEQILKKYPHLLN